MKRPVIAKAPDALRSIGEVVDETGVPAHVLRYWETHVPTLRPLRRAGGRRYFRAQDVTLVRRLQYLTETAGYTLEGAARAVRQDSGDLPGAVPVQTAVEVDVKLGALPADALVKIAAIRDRLIRALDPGP